MKEKTPKGYMWSGSKLTKVQTIWTNIGKATQNRENEWATEKPKLDTARELRRMCFNPGDEEYKEILKNARKNWKDEWHQPCHVKKYPKGIREDSRSAVWLKSGVSAEKS